MKRSDQGVTRTQRGEDQPLDKERAQTAHHTDDAKPSSSRQETLKDEPPDPALSGLRRKAADSWDRNFRAKAEPNTLRLTANAGTILGTEGLDHINIHKISGVSSRVRMQNHEHSSFH